MADLVYSPPGVYVSEDNLAVANLGTAVALPPSRLTLVGPSVNYTTYTEPVLLSGTTSVSLSKLGIISASITVASVTGTAYTLNTDFSVSQSGSPATEAVTTIARLNAGQITSGQVVYVTYQYADGSYFQPYVSTDFDEIQDRYGEAFNSTTGAINSPLTLAAKIAMEQGVRELILLPTQGSTTSQVTRTQLSTAYALLEARDDVGIVVPLTVGITGTDNAPGDTTNIASDLKTHTTTTSAAGNYRMGIFGYDKNANRTHSTVAASVADRRIGLVYPNIVNYFNGYLNKLVEIDGYYLAVAVAAQLSARNPQDPVTRKAVRSFSSIPDRINSGMTASAKNALSQAGVIVVEQTTDQRLVVRHGLATNTTSVLTREISITRARDAMIRLIFRSLDLSGLIGSATNDETPILVRSLVEGVLDQTKTTGMIVDYSNLSVRTNTADQTALDVKFAYRPSYPLNYVNVSFSVNTITGNTQEV